MDPPAKTDYSIKRGEAGTAVWALQRALNSTAVFVNLTEDGAFGPRTEGCVRTFQDLRKIDADGVAGPQTQQHLAQRLIASANEGLPGGLMLSIVEGESGALVAAVNWSVAKGVDCGYVQRRVLGPPFEDGAVRRAFDSLYQLRLVRSSLLQLHVKFYSGDPNNAGVYRRVASRGRHELSWRLAVLNHNYPYAADRISRVGISGLSDYWTTSQPWVMAIGARFPDGTPVKTPLDWCRHYSLGASEHNDPGRMVAHVRDWVA